MKKAAAVRPAIERLKVDAPDGPPLLGILLDEPTMRCLALGQCNSRAEVAARKVIADFDKHTLAIEKEASG